MQAHAADLRAEVTHLPEGERDAWVAAVSADWHTAELAEPDAVLCAFAEKLTRSPAEMREADVITLREHGFEDAAIHDAVQVIAYFNYINRIADATHVDLEEEMEPYA